LTATGRRWANIKCVHSGLFARGGWEIRPRNLCQKNDLKLNRIYDIYENLANKEKLVLCVHVF